MEGGVDCRRCIKVSLTHFRKKIEIIRGIFFLKIWCRKFSRKLANFIAEMVLSHSLAFFPTFSRSVLQREGQNSNLWSFWTLFFGKSSFFHLQVEAEVVWDLHDDVGSQVEGHPGGEGGPRVRIGVVLHRGKTLSKHNCPFNLIPFCKKAQLNLQSVCVFLQCASKRRNQKTTLKRYPFELFYFFKFNVRNKKRFPLKKLLKNSAFQSSPARRLSLDTPPRRRSSGTRSMSASPSRRRARSAGWWRWGRRAEGGSSSPKCSSQGCTSSRNGRTRLRYVIHKL